MRRNLLVLAFFLHFIRTGSAQSTQIMGDGHKIVPFRESLRSQGFDSTHDSLSSALKSSIQDIRVDASAVLVETKDPEAVTLIKSALTVESDPQTALWFGGMLMDLHDSGGQQTLVTACSNPHLATRIRAYAASQLAVRESGRECIAPLLTAFPDSAKERLPDVLTVLGQLYRYATSEQKESIARVLQLRLIDGTDVERVSSSRALRQIHLPGSATIIEMAFKNETNPSVRAAMSQDLAIIKTQSLR